MDAKRRMHLARALVLVVPASLAGALYGYVRGLDEANRKYSAEINAMRALQDSLRRAFARDGRFPPTRSGHYEFPGLTVSASSDTMVSYYSGVDADHLLMLHLSPDGTLSVSRR